MKQVSILAIVPAYNEEGCIFDTVKSIYALKRKIDVVVVNDGSKDATLKESSKTKAYVIDLPYNMGIGGAVQAGFKFAKDKGYAIALQVDGDGQHDVSFIEDLIAPLLKEEADMVIGSRFMPPFLGYQSSFVRRIGINFFAHLISLITQYNVTDPTSGFRAYNSKMINVFAQKYPVDYPEPEAIAIAGKYNARLLEVPVQMRKRAHGVSSIRYLKTLYYMIKVTFAIMIVNLQRRKAEL